MLRSAERPLCAAGLAFLYRGARHSRVGTIDAAVPFEWFQNRAAGRAFVEPLTRIRRHRFFYCVSAFRAGDR